MCAEARCRPVVAGLGCRRDRWAREWGRPAGACRGRAQHIRPSPGRHRGARVTRPQDRPWPDAGLLPLGAEVDTPPRRPGSPAAAAVCVLLVHMSTPRRRAGDDAALALALVSGYTIAEAADIAKMGERTARRRMGEPQLLARMSQLRGDLLRAASDQLSRSLGDASAVLVGLLGSESERTRLDAARCMLDQAQRLHAAVDVEARLTELERRIAADGRSAS